MSEKLSGTLLFKHFTPDWIRSREIDSNPARFAIGADGTTEDLA